MAVLRLGKCRGDLKGRQTCTLSCNEINLHAKSQIWLCGRQILNWLLNSHVLYRWRCKSFQINMLKKLLLFISSMFFTFCNAQSIFDIDKVLENERQDLAISDIDTYLNNKAEYGAKRGNLNSFQMTFLLVSSLEMEINNGGFNQFYYNSIGNYSKEIVDALTTIKAFKTAEIVKTANSEFNNNTVPKDRTIRQLELEKIETNAEKNWNKCDSEFLEYHDDLTTLLIQYVRDNIAEFKK